VEAAIEAAIGCRGRRCQMHKIHGGMSFKNLTGFNLTMIGKQAWKFQT